MNNFTVRTAVDRRGGTGLSNFIDECQVASTREEFCLSVYPKLQKILPHEMFTCGRVRIADLQILESMNMTFPSDYLREIVTADKYTTCPAIRSWIEFRKPVFIDKKSVLLRPEDKKWLEKFELHQIGNVVLHGVMNLGQEHANYFAFGGVHCWSKWEIFLLQMVVPQLHYALANIGDFGDKQPKQILTSREQEVLKWISSGKSNFEIASILGISSWTVKNHVGNLLSKLNASTRGHAVAKAVSFGLFEA